MKSSYAALQSALKIAGLALLLTGIGRCLFAEGQSSSTYAGRSASSNGTRQEPSIVGDCVDLPTGSPYIPINSWIYPEVLRLYSMGFLNRVFLNIRPWTRKAVLEMLDDVDQQLSDSEPGPGADEARSIRAALHHELQMDVPGSCDNETGQVRLESAYTVVRGISGTPLRDSFHLGSTITNDYGRPYANGVNSYSGVSGYATAGRFTLYARGEFQGAPSANGYSAALANALSTADETLYVNPITGQTTYYYPQTTIPFGNTAAKTHGRVLEAYISANVLNHEVSFGKVDQWLGPARGGSFAYSNNAENIYAFEVNRVEPLHIPLLSRVTGPFRYEFLIGSLHGHDFIPNPSYTGDPSVQPNVITPGNPWVHLEKISFRPTENLEMGFERTVIWGGKGHGPITLHSFWKSFFSVQNVTATVKYGPGDPGARFGAFDFSYRLPFVRKWLTLYSDGEVHDDVSPIDAPRRAAWRPGLYLSHFPGVPKLDMRAEVAWTDPPVDRSINGQFMYWETIQKQGYTNNGQLFGDWMGREAKGGQGWITYHLSGNEWIQVGVRNQKAPKDFIPGGTTINDIDFEAAKRLGQDLELRGSILFESWKAPAYLPGQQRVTTTTIQLTWHPKQKVSF